jgi:hypothetical protein
MIYHKTLSFFFFFTLVEKMTASLQTLFRLRSIQVFRLRSIQVFRQAQYKYLYFAQIEFLFRSI